MMDKYSKIKLTIPTWIARLYILLAIIIIPWTLYLSITLPTRHISRHWDESWVGLDVALTATLLLTGILSYLRSRWVAIFSTMTGSFLLVDAWFDITSERPGPQLNQAIILAIFFEVPLALMSFAVAHKVLVKNINKN